MSAATRDVSGAIDDAQDQIDDLTAQIATLLELRDHTSGVVDRLDRYGTAYRILRPIDDMIADLARELAYAEKTRRLDNQEESK